MKGGRADVLLCVSGSHVEVGADGQSAVLQL